MSEVSEVPKGEGIAADPRPVSALTGLPMSSSKSASMHPAFCVVASDPSSQSASSSVSRTSNASEVDLVDPLVCSAALLLE